MQNLTQKKILSSSFSFSASIILPSGKDEGGVVKRQRLNIGFAFFYSSGQGYLQRERFLCAPWVRLSQCAVLFLDTGGRLSSSAGFFFAASAAQPLSYILFTRGWVS